MGKGLSIKTNSEMHKKENKYSSVYRSEEHTQGMGGCQNGHSEGTSLKVPPKLKEESYRKT